MLYSFMNNMIIAHVYWCVKLGNFCRQPTYLLFYHDLYLMWRTFVRVVDMACVWRSEVECGGGTSLLESGPCVHLRLQTKQWSHRYDIANIGCTISNFPGLICVKWKKTGRPAQLRSRIEVIRYYRFRNYYHFEQGMKVLVGMRGEYAHTLTMTF